MIYGILILISAGLIWNSVYLLGRLKRQKETILALRDEVKFAADDYDRILGEYQSLIAKITRKAEVREKIPQKYTGPQLRVLNDRLNATRVEERTNSEILKEASNG